MVAIKLPIFSGMVPSIDPHLLADPNAAYARDTWLYSGALDGLPIDVDLHVLKDPSSAVVYRIPGNPEEPGYLANSFWMEFENPDTDFLRAPVSGDTHERYYWASSSHAPRYNTLARIKSDQPPFLLGLPVTGTLGVAVSGGTGAFTPRAYLSTLVTEYGEEGPASAPVLVNGHADSTYTITVPGISALNLGTDRNVKKVRVYRTIVGASGSTTYYLAWEGNASTTGSSFTDNMTNSILAMQRILESTAWTGPPSDMKGMVAMPNGILAGFRKNELWFSEAYRPHAWPAAYSLSLEHNIVGLAVTNQTLVVCTEGHPITASGVNPASITTSKLATFEPCISRGSIVATEEGVYYASPNGLILVNAGYAENITRKVISRDEWIGLTNRAAIRAGRLGTAYYAFGGGLPASFQGDAFQTDAIQVDSFDGTREGFMIDASNENAGVSYLSSGTNIINIKNDVWTGELLTMKGSKVTYMDQTPGYRIKPNVWRSKIFQTPDARNFTAFKCYFYIPTHLQNHGTGPRNNDINQEFDPNTQLLIVRVFADNRLVATHELLKSGELHRLPSGFKAEFWQIEIEGQVRVKSFQMATSIKELAHV